MPDVVTAQECREDCPPAGCLLAVPEHQHCPPRTRVRAADSLELTPQAPGSREGLPEDTVKVNALLWAGICRSPGPERKPSVLPTRGKEGPVFLERGEGWLTTGGFSNKGMDLVRAAESASISRQDFMIGWETPDGGLEGGCVILRGDLCLRAPSRGSWDPAWHPGDPGRDFSRSLHALAFCD